MRLLTILLFCSAGLPAADTFLMKSVDGGRSWADVATGLPDRFLRRLHIDGRNATLYALTQRDFGDAWHLSASTDGGETWQVRQSFPGTVWNMPGANSTGSEPFYLAYEVFGAPRKSVAIARIGNGGESLEQYPAEGLTIDPPPAGLGSSFDVLGDSVGGRVAWRS